MIKTKTDKSPRVSSFQQRFFAWADWFGSTSLPELLFVSTFILSRYYANIDFSYPGDIIEPLIIMGILSVVVYYIYRIFLRRLAAHLAALPAIYILYSFQAYSDKFDPVVRALLPGSLETSFTRGLASMLLVLVVCGVLGYLLSKLFHLKQLSSLQLSKVMLFAVAFIFVTQVGKVGLKLVQIMPELTYQPSYVEPVKDSSKPVTKPDIYYLVFDRYASNETLQREYNYDNSDLTNYLSEQGFVTRENAYANYAYTVSSVSSTMSMTYHTELEKRFGKDSYQTAFPYRHILNQPPIAGILKKDGYHYNQVSSWSDYTRLVSSADSNPSKSFRLHMFGWEYFPDDLARDIINKSILSPILKKGLTVGDVTVIKYDRDRNPYENFESQMTALKDIAKQKNDKPQFSFAHVLVPHDPYIYLADGKPAKYDSSRNDSGVDEKVKYTNQVTYLNKRMKDLVGTIRQNSPNAVIVIQSDEGPYPKEFRGTLSPTNFFNPATLPVPKMQQKVSILASYYMPGVDDAVVSENVNSSVNVFRFVLSNYLGYKLDMLPDCNFASGNKFNLFDYELITEKLKGQPAPETCSKY